MSSVASMSVCGYFCGILRHIVPPDSRKRAGKCSPKRLKRHLVLPFEELDQYARANNLFNKKLF